jgi:hypothetical protein
MAMQSAMSPSVSFFSYFFSFPLFPDAQALTIEIKDSLLNRFENCVRQGGFDYDYFGTLRKNEGFL